MHSAALKVLARHHVKATFCVLGVHAQALPQLVRQAHDEGHTIASHAMDHAGLDELSETDIRAKLEPASSILANITGQRPTLLGPPMGRSNDQVKLSLVISGWSSCRSPLTPGISRDLACRSS